MYGALLVGVSRSIPVIMDNAHIIDTIVYWLANLLSNFQGMLSAMGMLFVQISSISLSQAGQDRHL